MLNSPFLPNRVYAFLFALLGIVYIIGLFVPLMDNDAAHHANIALHMYLTNDYVNLVDMGNDYLDKPHLHFWLSAASYNIFGVNSFAYKFPSLLFSFLGVYSTYRLGKSLYNEEVGKLAALIIASAFGFLLANSDVRMDAILTACIAFASWQLIGFIQNKKLIQAAGAALGLALGFCTKGPVAVFVPAIAVFFYLLWSGNWKSLLDWKWVMMFLLFCLMIAPVIYCYYLQFNLHPEKIVRGGDNINGVKFILLDQVIDRFKGKMEKPGNKDHLFFLHAFLPAFAPWSILTWMAVIERIKKTKSRGQEWATAGVFITILIVVSLAGYQLPHYLNVVFPFAAVMVASYIFNEVLPIKKIKTLFLVQMILVFLLLLVTVFINAWAFPIENIAMIVCVIFFLSIVFYFLKSKQYSLLQRSITVPVAAMILLFFLLNSNFYPRLLKYQAGKELALASKGKTDHAEIYFWDYTYSSSFNFYTQTLRKQFQDSLLKKGIKTWIIYDVKDSSEIKKDGYGLGPESFIAIDYEISMLDLKFIDPSQREKQCTKMVLAEISK